MLLMSSNWSKHEFSKTQWCKSLSEPRKVLLSVWGPSEARLGWASLDRVKSIISC